MATAFSKQELVFFDDLIAGFDDGLVLGRNVSVYNADPLVLERSQNLQVWRPMPYVSTSIDGAAGTDISASFADVTQLSVPIGLGFNKSVPWTMTTDDLNDPQQRDRKMKSAIQRLGTDINLAIANVVGQQGTLVVKQTSAASGYDDLSLADALMMEQGLVGESRRVAVLHARDYNKVAGNLAKPQTSSNPKTNSAYEKAYVGPVSGFDTFKADYTYTLTAKAGVTVTVNDATAANRRYVPKATSTAATGETANVDNRYMNLTIAVTSGTVKVGDRFTINGVNAVHHITKADTGQLKTFTITAIVSGAGGSGVVTISPPIIVADGATQAEKEYANVTTTPSNGAAITFLNTTTGNVAAFWDERAIELLPGRNGFDKDLMASGAAAVQGTTELGVQVVMYRFFDINTKKFKYRVDTRFGVGMTNPEMAGVILFGQS
ncbi:MAG TPA: P22 phage major capsid protein family protein [Ramlibacter sp.]|uniref:P22 phage major capsid protein family protein n=1 Tax=Ramlibacter sp. TaxID=1917967 RepID=UPI002D7ED57A|nr:P22 phage major capsid protein family protein [Ramlibacter sp.]HET8744307.1 P22 phage major capsid protein family protein [Ramlibacter sp.]